MNTNTNSDTPMKYAPRTQALYQSEYDADLAVWEHADQLELELSVARTEIDQLKKLLAIEQKHLGPTP